MKMKVVVCSVVISLFCVVVLTSSHSLAKNGPEVPVLSKKGQLLESHYAAELESLRKEIKKALPTLDSRKVANFLKAAELERELAEGNCFQRLVTHNKDHAKRVSSAAAQLAEAKENLKKAEASPDDQKAEAVKTAEEELAKKEKNYENTLTRKKESDAFLAELTAARANTFKALKDLNLDSFLASDKLDPMLLKFEVLLEATPAGLAGYAQRGIMEEKQIAAFLKKTTLLKQMLIADGAKTTKHHKNQEGYADYGKALQIYNDIKWTTKNMPKDPVLQRLALACALEHAVPVKQTNPAEQTDAPPFVDPVKRYLHFEKAFLDGELHSNFKDLTTWDLRQVVNGDETEEALAWGREMLRNYRPDHLLTDDLRWRYVGSVRTEISYGSQYNKYDEPRLHKYQNILKNGGVCGRRAFFGRFILRAFGIPTVARPQSGHAALARWTPDGWGVCLGGGWGAGSTSTPYRKDLNLLESTQARVDKLAYEKVKRAQWIADALAETRMLGLYGHEEPEFGLWTSISLYTQSAILEELRAKTLEAIGTEIAEADIPAEDEASGEIKFTEEDKKIVIAKDGTITIPAAACCTPTTNTKKILFMESVLGGKQLHYGRHGEYESFEYVFEVPKAGNYELTARVVTPSWKQNLLFSLNEGTSVNIDLPYTVGMWETTKPVKITLKQGENRLRFFRVERKLEDSRDKGISIRNFTLKPTK